MSFSRLMCVLLVMSLLVGCENDPAEQAQATQLQEPVEWFEYLQGEYTGEQQITSAITGVTYPYHVYLPANYHEQKDKKFPVFYTLDGQWNFQGFAWGMERNKFEVIVVGIEEGPKGSNRRGTDYVLPGVVKYMDFIRQELMPLIEGKYRIDEHKRSFQGTSLGGVAATVMMLVDDSTYPLFQHYVADDASYWNEPEQLSALFEKRLSTKYEMTANLYLTSAFPLGNYYSVSSFLDHLEVAAIPKLNVYHEWYFTTHEKILSASMDETLALIYKK